MQYSIVFSSHTGNTAKLAEEVHSILLQEDCIYFGTPDITSVQSALVFIGFWTDKGICDAANEHFLKDIRKKTVFLFGTAGFGGNPEYFDKIMDSVKSNLDPSNKVIGSFMCQGKMPSSVRNRYEKMLTGGEEDSQIRQMIENFDRALLHPDQNDLEHLKEKVLDAMKNIVHD